MRYFKFPTGKVAATLIKVKTSFPLVPVTSIITGLWTQCALSISQENVHLPNFNKKESDDIGLVPISIQNIR